MTCSCAQDARGASVDCDAALQHFGFNRLEPRARLPGRDAAEAQALAAGIALPDDYVYFCSAHGAGAFDKHAMLTLLPGCALGRDFRLDTLYAVGAGEDWNPITLLEDTYLDRLPEGLLPIGSDPEKACCCSAPRIGPAHTYGIMSIASSPMASSSAASRTSSTRWLTQSNSTSTRSCFSGTKCFQRVSSIPVDTAICTEWPTLLQMR